MADAGSDRQQFDDVAAMSLPSHGHTTVTMASSTGASIRPAVATPQARRQPVGISNEIPKDGKP
jgi:hypothetical protein